MGTDDHGILLGSAALELLAVNKAGKVEHGGVAKLKGTVVHGDHAGLLVTALIELCIDHFIGYIILLHGYFYTLVGAELTGGLEDDGSLDIAAFGLGIAENGILGLESGHYLLLGDSVEASLLNCHIKLFIPECSVAVLLFDHLAGSLAVAEAGHGIFGTDAVIRGVQSLDVIFSGKFEGQLDLAGFDGGDFRHMILRNRAEAHIINLFSGAHFCPIAYYFIIF